MKDLGTIKLLIATVLLVNICLFGCKTSQPKQDVQAQGRTIEQKQTSEVGHMAIASDKLGPDTKLQVNQDSSMVLAYKMHQKPGRYEHKLAYMVMDYQTGDIIHQESVMKGYVSWHNAHQLKISYTLGIVAPDESAQKHYLYDLKLKKRIYQRVAEAEK